MHFDFFVHADHVLLYENYLILFQIEDTLDSMFAFVTETKTALEQIINISSSTSDKNCPSYGEKRKKSNVGEALGRSLKNVSYLCKIYYFYINKTSKQIQDILSLNSFESFISLNTFIIG